MTIANQIWNMKYRFEDEPNVEATWRRIAKALASVEKDPALWEDIFYAALEGYRFLPAGRITAGAGTGRKVTLSNCYVSGTIEDDMADIFLKVQEAALTMQQGGGIGYDFSTIRPKGAFVNGVAADASGPLTFMDVFDAACKTIMSAGSRRGAQMATMRCDHPSIYSFIEAKRDPGRMRNFNLSVLATDAFMAAVKADEPWDLVFGGKVYETIKAKDLWNKMMKSTYDYAEPGVIFIDRINQKNNLNYCETISATNPCGEQPLPPYGACLLGSINLAVLVRDAFTAYASIDMMELAKLVRVSIRMMDNVVDVGNYPLWQQHEESKNKRRLGLGVTGLADALLMMGVTYGSDQAVKLTEDWTKAIARAAYTTSALLAKEKGAFPLLDIDKYLAPGTSASDLPKEVQDLIREHGIRNALLTSIAPTGTISLYANNVSSGIEPVFAFSYIRKVTQKDGSKTEEEVVDYAVGKWREVNGDMALPDYFVSAQTLAPAAHVRMQAAAQKWIDSAISKTINCPEDISFEDLQQVYMDAYDNGCKGCTTYRPNDITGSVLSVGPTKVQSNLADRPGVISGETYKLKWPGNPHAMYITINDLDGQPFEIFINSKSVEHFAHTVALTRMISAIFRRGGDVTFVAKELKAVFDPRGGAWVEGAYIPSMLAAIGDVIEKHMGLTKPVGTGPACQSCGSTNTEKKSGCFVCNDCGDSKCG